MKAPADTVFVVDDDPAVREAVGGLLRSIGMQPQPFASAGEFLAAKPPATPSCVILDVRMPGLSGLDCQQRIAEAGFRIPVIFMTGHADVPMSVRAMKAGAVEFLTKPFRDQDLIDAVNQALERDRARRVADEAMATLRERFASLTPRERDVMEGVVAGKLNKQIAGDLGTSEVTVKVHRGQMMRKLGVDSVADLVRMSARLGWPA
jgi:FixJ family two-component response regulator